MAITTKISFRLQFRLSHGLLFQSKAPIPFRSACPGLITFQQGSRLTMQSCGDHGRRVKYRCFTSPWSSFYVASVLDAHNNTMARPPTQLLERNRFPWPILHIFVLATRAKVVNNRNYCICIWSTWILPYRIQRLGKDCNVHAPFPYPSTSVQLRQAFRYQKQ